MEQFVCINPYFQSEFTSEQRSVREFTICRLFSKLFTLLIAAEFGDIVHKLCHLKLVHSELLCLS
jgi:hypothetical protein